MLAARTVSFGLSRSGYRHRSAHECCMDRGGERCCFLASHGLALVDASQDACAVGPHVDVCQPREAWCSIRGLGIVAIPLKVSL